MTAETLEDYVYLDWAATAPLCEEAARAMEPYQQPGRDNILVNANANSVHLAGRNAFQALEKARSSIAQDINATRPSEIVFTSGATESNNTALLGMAQAAADLRIKQKGSDFVPHIITSAIEHDAILHPVDVLRARNWRVSVVQPNREGFIEPKRLAELIDDDTVLVSIQMANSEVGSVQPLADLVSIAHEHKALFHTDAVQALGKIALDVEKLNIDAASFAAHKISGPKGIGALYLRAHTPFMAYMLGGNQENARRSGTQNVAGAVGFAAACHALCTMRSREAERLKKLRDKLYAALDDIQGIEATVKVLPGSDNFLPNIVHMLADHLESESLVLRLDELGFAVSGGSACASHALSPSHVLRAMGVRADRLHNAVRVSMGRYTTEADIDSFIRALKTSLDWS